MDDGKPQSIYRLDTEGLERIGLVSLAPGEFYDFKVGSITFDGFVPWINLQVIHDPGKSYALAGGVFALLGALGMLFIHRRRIWIRFTPNGERSTIEIAGLCQSNDEVLLRDLEMIREEVEKDG